MAKLEIEFLRETLNYSLRFFRPSKAGKGGG